MPKEYKRKDRKITSDSRSGLGNEVVCNFYSTVQWVYCVPHHRMEIPHSLPCLHAGIFLSSHFLSWNPTFHTPYENRYIRVSHSKHLINRSCESQNICNLVPSQIIQNIIPHSLSFSYIILSIWHPFLTNDHISKIMFYLKQSFKHDDYWSKSCFSNSK